MAGQKGLIKLKGAIGDITFYKTKDGYLAREKGGVDATRIANDPNFQRTRETTAVINLSNAVTPNSTQPLFLAVGIEFYQELNGVNYPVTPFQVNAGTDVIFVNLYGINDVSIGHKKSLIEEAL